MKAGDYVVPIFHGECGKCIFCKSEDTNLCENFGINPMKKVMVNDGKSRFWTKDLKPIFHFLNTSTFSEYTVIDSACVVKIDPSIIPLKQMALLSCCISTGISHNYFNILHFNLFFSWVLIHIKLGYYLQHEEYINCILKSKRLFLVV